MENHKHEVRIHIDQKPYESPNPTTGEALYKLGHVQPGYDLFREVKGDREDPVVENDDEPIHLREDEHFHSGPAQPRKYTIIVNGQKKIVTTKTVTFDEIVKLAFPTPPTGREHPVHRLLRGRPARQPARLAEGGPKRQGEERDDLQCHSDR